MLIAQGQLYIDQQLQNGGIVSPPQLTPIDVQEIVRCTALAIKRRGEIMGPVCPHDKLTEDIAMVLGRHPGPANHWSESWIDLELGDGLCGRRADRPSDPAVETIVGGGGRVRSSAHGDGPARTGPDRAGGGDYDSASKYFEEASYSAVEYDDDGTLEEAFYYGEQAHLMANRPGLFPPLKAAIAWSRTRNRELWTSLLLLEAENNALLNQTAPAAAALTEAKTALASHTMGKFGDIASRFHYLAALIDFQSSQVAAGNKEIQQSILLQREASKWLFQIKLADYYVEGQKGPHLGAHRALELYRTLLRDPTPIDWAARRWKPCRCSARPTPAFSSTGSTTRSTAAWNSASKWPIALGGTASTARCRWGAGCCRCGGCSKRPRSARPTVELAAATAAFALSQICRAGQAGEPIARRTRVGPPSGRTRSPPGASRPICSPRSASSAPAKK